ncbi:MAG TPA: Cna B-type domain-containing protein, partial [Candidatus Eisenbacteria bacterium]|nr:Cna B-type domain-containing protein [Candidatus Eisenbacteria bacterium]
DWNLNIGPAANRTLITDLRAESLYTVSELNQVSAFGDIINLDPFDTKIEIKEGLTGSFVEKNTFEIDTDSNGHPNEDIYIKITNQFKEIDVEANKVWEGGPADKPAIDLQLYRKTNAANSQELLTGYTVTLDGNEATAWHHKWENLPTYNSQGLAYQYFVRETNLPDNYTADAVDDLTITNTYKYKTVIISKRVTGNMGDLNKAFSFTATLSDGATFPDIDVEGYTISTDGKTASFALKDEEFLTLTVPSNSQINLTESDNAGYTVSYSVNNGSAQTGGQITNLELEDASTTIEFTNHKDEYIDSGINLDSLPYLIIIGVAVLGGIIWIIKKRKKTDLS